MIERLEDVLHVGRPIHAGEDSMMGLLRLEGDRTHAPCVQVQVGKVSVSTIEIRTGLSEGDAVVLSDTSAWGAYERIRLGVIHQPLPVRMVAAAHTARP